MCCTKHELKLWLELGVEIRYTKSCAAHAGIEGTCCMFEGGRCVKSIPRASVLSYPKRRVSCESLDDTEESEWFLKLRDDESVHVDYRTGSDVYDLAILNADGDMRHAIQLRPTSASASNVYVFRNTESLPYRVLKVFEMVGSETLQDMLFVTNESLYTERAWAGLLAREQALGARLSGNKILCGSGDEVIAHRTFRIDLHI